MDEFQGFLNTQAYLSKQKFKRRAVHWFGANVKQAGAGLSPLNKPLSFSSVLAVPEWFSSSIAQL